MNEREKLATSEKAYKDYISGMKYKDIADRYEVSINTVKSWKKRYKWTRESTQKKVCNQKSVHELGNNLRDEIREDLIQQLEEKSIHGKVYVDLVDDYMSFWDIKNRLIEDIKFRGVSVEWVNGKQAGNKKNDSIGDVIKTSAQMLKILNDLGIKSPVKADNYGI